jgi:hypothetical protein
MSTASPVEWALTFPDAVMMLWPHFREVIVRRKPRVVRYWSIAITRRSICPVATSSRPQE